MTAGIRVAVACLLLVALAAIAENVPEPADQLVHRISDEVLQILDKVPPGKRDLPIDDETFASLRATVEPHFDLTRMTALAVGAPWRTASAMQREQLEAEFRTLLVRTYGKAISRDKVMSIDYLPLGASASERRVVVRTRFHLAAAPVVAVDYRLENSGQAWRVYDVVVDGVSLIVTYRNTFAGEIAQRGIDGLIELIASKNAELLSADGGA